MGGDEPRDPHRASRAPRDHLRGSRTPRDPPMASGAPGTLPGTSVPPGTFVWAVSPQESFQRLQCPQEPFQGQPCIQDPSQGRERPKKPFQARTASPPRALPGTVVHLGSISWVEKCPQGAPQWRWCPQGPSQQQRHPQVHFQERQHPMDSDWSSGARRSQPRGSVAPRDHPRDHSRGSGAPETLPGSVAPPGVPRRGGSASGVTLNGRGVPRDHSRGTRASRDHPRDPPRDGGTSKDMPRGIHTPRDSSAPKDLPRGPRGPYGMLERRHLRDPDWSSKSCSDLPRGSTAPSDHPRNRSRGSGALETLLESVAPPGILPRAVVHLGPHLLEEECTGTIPVVAEPPGTIPETAAPQRTLPGASTPPETFPGMPGAPRGHPRGHPRGGGHPSNPLRCRDAPRVPPSSDGAPRGPRNISSILRCILRNDGTSGILTGAANPAVTYPGAAQPSVTIPETVPGAVVHWKPSQECNDTGGNVMGGVYIKRCISKSNKLSINYCTHGLYRPGAPMDYLRGGGHIRNPPRCCDAPTVSPSGDGAPRRPRNISGILRCILRSDGTPGTLTGAAEPGTLPGPVVHLGSLSLKEEYTGTIPVATEPPGTIRKTLTETEAPQRTLSGASTLPRDLSRDVSGSRDLPRGPRGPYGMLERQHPWDPDWSSGACKDLPRGSAANRDHPCDRFRGSSSPRTLPWSVAPPGVPPRVGVAPGVTFIRRGVHRERSRGSIASRDHPRDPPRDGGTSKDTRRGIHTPRDLSIDVSARETFLGVAGALWDGVAFRVVPRDGGTQGQHSPQGPSQKPFQGQWRTGNPPRVGGTTQGSLPGAVVHLESLSLEEECTGTIPGAAEPPGTIPETLPGTVTPQRTLPGASTPPKTFPGMVVPPETFLGVPGGRMACLGACNISGILRCIFRSDGTPGTMTGAAEPTRTYPGAAQSPESIPVTVSEGVAHREPWQSRWRPQGSLPGSVLLLGSLSFEEECTGTIPGAA
ncbi:nascent polypeptide-associated complex subunit alpha, muscle-specific form-like [Homarus americanus]|uniref:nascent polypeptide-associated complex subunit alpha, muscle-specific form-like n=1 Tax=Homarus americanus TaxID=6706 RepID=UPI001C475307|nr:nascent polypeptide-associated complex subunit alpha, muscle-specific form-like [Homarus americanus]